jgi:hypothetical protein
MASKGSPVGVATMSEGAVVRLRRWIEERGGARPVIARIPEARVAGISHRDDASRPTLAGHRGQSAQGA